MKILTLEQTIKLYSGIMIIILLLVISFVIYPSWKSVYALQEDITNTETILEHEYRQSRELQRSLREMGTVKNNISEFSHAFIVPGDELSFITTLENMADMHGVTQTLSIAEGGNTAVGRDIKPYVITFSVQGTLPAVLAHMHILETAPFLLSIPAVILSKNTARGSNTSLLSLTFDAYVYAHP